MREVYTITTVNGKYCTATIDSIGRIITTYWDANKSSVDCKTVYDPHTGELSIMPNIRKEE